MKSLSNTKSLVRTTLLVAMASLPMLASAATTVVGGGDSQGNGFFGISFGGSNNGGFGGGNFGCTGTVCGVAGTILYLINGVAVPLLFAVAFITFLYGVANKYIINGDKANTEGNKFVLWGIIGFVIMISVWGLVNVVANTFGLTGAYAPPLPRSY